MLVVKLKNKVMMMKKKCVVVMIMVFVVEFVFEESVDDAFGIDEYLSIARKKVFV